MHKVARHGRSFSDQGPQTNSVHAPTPHHLQVVFRPPKVHTEPKIAVIAQELTHPITALVMKCILCISHFLLRQDLNDFMETPAGKIIQPQISSLQHHQRNLGNLVKHCNSPDESVQRTLFSQLEQLHMAFTLEIDIIQKQSNRIMEIGNEDISENDKAKASNIIKHLLEVVKTVTPILANAPSFAPKPNSNPIPISAPV